MTGPVFIHPDWAAPPGVRAVATTRPGGYSAPPFDRLNLGDHVGDEPAAVGANRALLRRALALPDEPCWLDQVHGAAVVEAAPEHRGAAADASVATKPGAVCAVLTADCLPVLLCGARGQAVAAAHAGWRGLAAGVIEAALARMATPPAEVLAWLGPAIGPHHYEIGEEVFHAFVDPAPETAAAFSPSRPGHWWADLYRLARHRLRAAGVERIYGGGFCTAGEPARFFSYRRDGKTGRMASLIWLQS